MNEKTLFSAGRCRQVSVSFGRKPVRLRIKCTVVEEDSRYTKGIQNKNLSMYLGRGCRTGYGGSNVQTGGLRFYSAWLAAEGLGVFAG